MCAGAKAISRVTTPHNYRVSFLDAEVVGIFYAFGDIFVFLYLCLYDIYSEWCYITGKVNKPWYGEKQDLEINHDMEGLVLKPVEIPVENQDMEINQDI